MLPMYGIAAHKDLSELRQNCNTAAKKREALAEQYEYLNQELEKKRKQREDLRRNLAVAERRIKDIQKDVFLMNSKQSELDETSIAMIQEVANNEIQLSALKELADKLTQQSKATSEDVQQIIEDLPGLEADYSSVFQKVAELEKEQRDLSNDIVKCLVNTSLERAEVENDLNNQSTAFLKSIDERMNAEQRLSEQKASSEKLSAIRDELAQKVMDIEAIRLMEAERKLLHTEVVQLDADFQSLDATRMDLLSPLNDKQKQFDALVAQNTDAKKAIVALEAEVGPYEKIISEVNTAQAASDHVKRNMIQVSDELMEKLVRKAELEEALQGIWDKFDELTQILTG
jgi:chromosome segregation ATPase